MGGRSPGGYRGRGYGPPREGGGRGSSMDPAVRDRHRASQAALLRRQAAALEVGAVPRTIN